MDNPLPSLFQAGKLHPDVTTGTPATQRASTQSRGQRHSPTVLPCDTCSVYSMMVKHEDFVTDCPTFKAQAVLETAAMSRAATSQRGACGCYPALACSFSEDSSSLNNPNQLQGRSTRRGPRTGATG